MQTVFFPAILHAVTFQAETQEGIMATYEVIDESAKTCQIGIGINGYSVSTSTAVASGTAGTVTIPSTVNGYTVIAVSWGAFRGCNSLTTVVLPYTIEIIRPLAF